MIVLARKVKPLDVSKGKISMLHKNYDHMVITWVASSLDQKLPCKFHIVKHRPHQSKS